MRTSFVRRLCPLFLCRGNQTVQRHCWVDQCLRIIFSFGIFVSTNGNRCPLCTGKQDGRSQWRRRRRLAPFSKWSPSSFHHHVALSMQNPTIKLIYWSAVGMFFVLKISVPIPSLNQDLNTQRSGFYSLRSTWFSVWCREYGQRGL